ncbi:MAG: hypothetical protein WC829_05865 [Hyphomicrobium sp.]|jgi:hypothetical protein
MSITLKRDFSAPILDLDNKPILPGATMEGLQKALGIAFDGVPEDKRDEVRKAAEAALNAPMTLGAVCAQALTSPGADKQPLPEGVATTRLALALKVNAGGTIEITTAERDLLKDLVGKFYLGAVVPGRVAMLLEDAPTQH